MSASPVVSASRTALETPEMLSVTSVDDVVELQLPAVSESRRPDVPVELVVLEFGEAGGG